MIYSFYHNLLMAIESKTWTKGQPRKLLGILSYQLRNGLCKEQVDRYEDDGAQALLYLARHMLNHKVKGPSTYRVNFPIETTRKAAALTDPGPGWQEKRS